MGPSLYRHPSRAELRWAALFALALMALTCLPYLAGLALKPGGSYYSGFIANPDEHNVYLSLMRQARDGSLLFRDMFTSEPQTGRVINVLWLVLGLLARVTHLPLPVVYHLARVAAGWLLLMAVYCLGAQVLRGLTARRAAVVLAATASGLGWALHVGPGQPNPIDFGPGLIMPEAITFLTLLLNPLFALSVFLLVVIYLAAAHAFASGSVRAAVLAGIAALVLGDIHTYDLIPVAGVLAVFLAYALITRHARGRAIVLGLLIAVIALPSLLYQLWLQHSGDVSMLVKATNQPPSPEPLYVALGLGIPLLFALVGAVFALRSNDWARLLVLWLLLGAAAVYAPVAFQRKLIEGLHLPIVLLAMVALERVVAGCGRFPVVQSLGCSSPKAGLLPDRGQPLRTARKDWTTGVPGAAERGEDRYSAATGLAVEPGAGRCTSTSASRRLALAAALLVVLALPSDLAFLARAGSDLVTNNAQYLGNLMPPLYLTRDQRAALGYLSAHTTRSDVLLTNSFLSNYAASLAGMRVHFGHWSETPDFTGKVQEYAHFLQAATPDAAREELVRAHGITYLLRDRGVFDQVYLGPDGRAFDAERTPWLEAIFSQGDVSIYRVKGR